MSLESGIFGRLSPVLSVGTRIYPSKLPQGVTLPAVVYQLIPSEGPLYTHDGDTGLDRGRVQFDCWADTFDAAIALHAELRSEISGESATWDDVTVNHCLFEGHEDDQDKKTGAHRRSDDALIWYHAT